MQIDDEDDNASLDAIVEPPMGAEIPVAQAAGTVPPARTIHEPIPPLRELKARLIKIPDTEAAPGGEGADRNAVLLEDPEGFAAQPAVLSTWAYTLALLFDGRRSAVETAAAFREKYAQAIMPEQALTLQNELEQALFLNSSTFEDGLRQRLNTYLEMPMWPCVHAGSAYPADPGALTATFEGFFANPEGPGKLEPLSEKSVPSTAHMPAVSTGDGATAKFVSAVSGATTVTENAGAKGEVTATESTPAAAPEVSQSSESKTTTTSPVEPGKSEVPAEVMDDAKAAEGAASLPAKEKETSPSAEKTAASSSTERNIRGTARREAVLVRARSSTVMKKVPVRTEPVRGLIVPHIDLRVGGATYAHAYHDLMFNSKADLIFVLGVAHQFTGDHLFSVTRKDFDTPLGKLNNAREISTRLHAASGADDIVAEMAHRGEHSIEFQAALLKVLLGERCKRNVEIVPVLCGSIDSYLARDVNPFSDGEFLRFTQALRKEIETCGRNWCVLCSVDLSHVGPEFGHSSMIDERLLLPLERMDRKMLALVEKLDVQGFFNEIARTQNSRHVDAVLSVMVMLSACQGFFKPGRLLHYDQMLKAPTHSAVSYAAMSFDAAEMSSDAPAVAKPPEVVTIPAPE